MNSSPDAVAVTITIMEKEYMVACPQEERDELVVAARYLDERMRETRDGGKVLGTERMAVMTALNIVHDFLQQQRQQELAEKSVDDTIQSLQLKVEGALGRRQETEALD